jgi:ubiquinone/menaquinone biosynthesis C-methylase UbiE
MLEIARKRAADLAREVDLRLGDAEALPFSDDSFDTVVCTFALCTIPNERQAVVEVHRVLRPGGRFLWIEHVGSPARPVHAVQSLLDKITVRLEGDHQTREPLDHVEPVGLRIEELQRSKWGIVERGAAVKPSHGESVR